ncbi:MAG: hypothetical protein ACFFE2_09375 [Candidatus Thorarchaeota archaeon]
MMRLIVINYLPVHVRVGQCISREFLPIGSLGLLLCQRHVILPPIGVSMGQSIGRDLSPVVLQRRLSS